MLDLITVYILIGGLVILFINALYYITHHPVLTPIENMICMLVWPAVIGGCIREWNRN